MGATRVLECIFAFYFLTHIPITLLIDLQAFFPAVYPQGLRDFLAWYTASFKDALMADPPPWFRSFVLCESFVQLPFFPVAAYAFWKGKCKWIRTPAIIYATHVATTLVPVLAHFLFHDFSGGATPPGPETLAERLTLVGIYVPYLLVPLLMLLLMLLSPEYNQEEKKKKW